MPQAWQQASKERHFDPAGYFSTRTVVALITPPGGAVCGLRISGSDAIRIASSISSSDYNHDDHRRARRVWLKDADGSRIDDALVIPFFAPHSFTGEDLVEVFIHGSPLIAQKVLEECFVLGARLALPGEFSFRAVKNGKMSLSQAEAIKDVISADNDFSLELALEKLSGVQHQLIGGIQESLMQLCVLAEAGIDFSDQDLDEVSLPRLKERLRGIVHTLESLRGSFDRGRRFNEGIPVSIFGLPNAGKSSFFNALLGEDRSIVSDVAGTTRDIVREKISLRGRMGIVSLRLSDTAGLRDSLDAVEEIGIQRSLKSAAESDVVIVVVDGLSPQLDAIKDYLGRVPAGPRDFVLVISKEDCLGETDQQSLAVRAQEVFGQTPLFASSRTLRGIAMIAERIAMVAEERMKRAPGEVLLTNAEHVSAVAGAIEHLLCAEGVSDLVLFSAELRHAMNSLGPLIGNTLPDDVLGKIFSDFCIGK